MSAADAVETCEICGQQGFVSESDVKTHMLLDHEENSGSCPFCDLAHVTVEELAFHINTAHHSLLSPTRSIHTTKGLSHGYDCAAQQHSPYVNDDDVKVANEVREHSPLMYIEDYFAEPTSCSIDQNAMPVCAMQNGHDSISEGAPSIEDAHAAIESNCDNGTEIHVAEAVMSNMEENGTGDGSVLEEHTTGDLFSDSVSEGDVEQSDEVNEPECMLVTKEEEVLPERRVVRLETARTGPNDESQNGRKRGRREPDVRPKDTKKSPPSESKDSQQSLDMAASSRSESENGKVETSSPFRKLLRTFTGSKSEGKEAAEKDRSGIWVDLTNDSEPDLIDDDSFMIIEDALPADEVQWEDIPSTSSALSTSTPSKSRSKTTSSSTSTTKADSKPTLLSLSQSSRNAEGPLLCPFCGFGTYDGDVLNCHINSDHPEGAVGGTASTQVPAGNVGAAGGGDISCPVCGLEGLGVDDMNTHVEGHFAERPETGNRSGVGDVITAEQCPERQGGIEEMDRRLAEQLAEDERKELRRKEEEEFKKLQKQYGAEGRGSFSRQSEDQTSRAVWRGQISPLEYHQRRLETQEAQVTGIDSGQTRTKEIIPRLLDYYGNGVHGVSFARLCYNVDHFSSSPGDLGWGCGYRNIQMMLSSLVGSVAFRDVVFNGRSDIPSIPRLQLLIEDAWGRGWDEQGRDQLSGKVHNTRKWIGATEVIAMFASLRIKCQLMDFHAPTGPNGTHPRLFSWIKDYFGKPSILPMDSGLRSNKLPLYLQHEGHSRTVIGYDMMKDKSIRLLLFDPSMKVTDANALRRGDITGHLLKPVRKTLSQMKARQYQIVCVEGLMSSDQEYEKSKLLTSQRIP